MSKEMLYNAFFRRSFFRTLIILCGAVFLAIPAYSGAAVSQIATGYDHSVVIQSDGSLWIWGANTYGQIGDGTTTNRLTPLHLDAGTGLTWVSIAAGKFYTLAVRSDGTLWGWGSNYYSQLGDGTALDRHSPVRIGNDSDWLSVSSGTLHSIALKSNGTLWAWGRNQAGQLGDGTKIDRATPVQIGTDSDWAVISGGTSHSVALKSNGTLWAWGANNEGQLGNGSTVQQSSPGRIGADSDWAAIDAGNKHTAAVKSGGTLWTWGGNSYGDDDPLVSSLVPEQFGTDSNWESIALNSDHALAVKTDGSLWAYGSNSSGQLGNGTTIDSYTAIQVGAGIEWRAVATGDLHTVALSSDGSVWIWGDNSYGQLGDGTTSRRLSPGPVAVNTVSAAAGPNGTISPSTANVNWGAGSSFTVTPDTWYRADLVSSCSGTLSGNTYTTGPVTADCTVNATFFRKMFTITAIAGANGSITPVGDISVEEGSTGAFTVTPGSGYRVESVTGCGGSLSGDTFITAPITVDCAINAAFAINTYTINANVGENGSITPPGPVTVTHGSSQNFTMTPSPGYHVEEVLVDGVVVGPQRPMVIGVPLGGPFTYLFENITSDHTISATFAPNPPVMISATAGTGGTITPSGEVTFLSETDKTFTIQPETGYGITDVQVDGVSVGAVSSYTFASVMANHTISAVFGIRTFVIQASAGPNGTISPSGSVTVTEGSSQSFTMTPVPGYHVEQVLVDGVLVGPFRPTVIGVPLGDPYTYTFNTIAGPHTISATFAPNPQVTITATPGENGSISPSGDITFLSETDRTFTIRAAAGFAVLDVLVDGASVGAVSSYTFTKVMTNHVITAVFRPAATFVITATAGSNGTITPSGEVPVPEGSSMGFSIIAAANCRISSVTVDGVNKGAIGSYTFTNVTGTHTISAHFSPTVTSSAGANGAISPKGTMVVQNEGDITYTITPYAGYHVADVLVDGVSIGVTVTDPPLSRAITYTLSAVAVPHTVNAVFAPNPPVVISATATAGGSISPSGEVSVPSEGGMKFTITPEAGFRIASITVDGVDKGAFGSYTFTNVTGNHTINAAFSPTVISAAGQGGAISPKGTMIVPSGSDMTYTITPYAGYHVADVLVDGMSMGVTVTDSPLSRAITYTLSAVTVPHTINAVFAPNPALTITATAGQGGAISPSGEVSVPSEGSMQFMITPQNGYRIVSVIVDGVDKGAIGSYTFTNVLANHAISALFSPTVTSSAGPGGTISPVNTVVVPAGGDITYTLTPDAGYHVADVLVDGASMGVAVTDSPLSRAITYTLSAVTVPHTINAVFAPNPSLKITATAGQGGSISPSGEVSVPSEGGLKFTIAAETGYRIASVIVDGVDQGAISTYTFTNVLANHTISALFSPTVTSSAGLGGAISPINTVVVPTGGDITYTITPYAGYHVADVLVDGVSMGVAVTDSPLSRAITYTLSAVTVPHTINAVFAPNPSLKITATAGQGGSISPSGEVSVPIEGSMRFTIAAETGYRIASVLVDGVNNGAITSYTFTNVAENHTINAVFSPTVISSAGQGGAISPKGTVIVPSGSDMTYTITPYAGYHVSDVLVDGVSMGVTVTDSPLSRAVTYTLSAVTVPHTVSAVFASNPPVAISAKAAAGGSISPSGETAVPIEGSMKFMIAPQTGYRIASVVVDGVNQGAISTYTFTNVAENHTISAAFSPTVISSAGAGGAISPRGTMIVPGGSDMTYTITPYAGYHVESVLVDGVPASDVVIQTVPMSSPVTYTLTAVTVPHTVHAVFAPNPSVTITATAGQGGSISPSGEVAVLTESNMKFMIVAQAGYRIASVIVDDVDQGAISSYTFTNVTATHTIRAVFSPTITSSSGAGGTISPKGITIVPGGNDMTYTITPYAGYHIADVHIDGVSAGPAPSYTFTGVTVPHTIAATFAVN